jgi:hypothetical protein
MIMLSHKMINNVTKALNFVATDYSKKLSDFTNSLKVLIKNK